MAQETVASGQRYRDIFPGRFGPSNAEWTVEEVVRAMDGLHYARMFRTDNRTERKTLSLAILTDRRRFARVTE